MGQPVQESTTAIVLSATPKVSGIATAGGAAIWGMNADEWTIIAMIGGLAFTALTFVANVIYRHLEYKRNS